MLKEEMETNIRWDRSVDEGTIYTADPYMRKRIDRLCVEAPDVYSLIHQDEYGARYTIKTPYKNVKLRKPAPESKRAAARLRMQNINRSNGSNAG